jgi:ribosomal protein S1
MDDKEYAVDVIKKQLIEAKRDAIAKRAKEATANFKKGAIRKGTVQDLYKDLEID